MIIYVDVLIITNFVISYFLLLTASVLSGYTYSRKRIIMSAALGALSCLYIFVQLENPLSDAAVRMVSLLLCAVTAFGYRNKKKFIVQTVYYVVLNALLTGVISALSLKSSAVYHNNMFFYFDINPVELVVLSVLIYVVLCISELVKERISPQKCITLDIYFDSFFIKDVKAFYDSGFKVKDIVSNKDVIAVSYVKLKEYIPPEIQRNIENFMTAQYEEVKCMFVPVIFNTLSGNGMLPAMKAEYIKANDRTIKNIIVAFTDNELSENVDAIFGASVKRQL